MNEKALNQLTKARIDMIMLQPFFGTLALRLSLVEDPSCPTLWVDGKRIGYNPEFVLTLTHELTVAAVAHEVGHCIFDHISRRGPRNAQKWNRAGDYVINAMLNDAGFTIGESWLYDPAFAGMSADAVYNLLPDQPDDGGNPLCDIRQSEPDPKQIDEWKMATAQAANAARAAGKLSKDLERFVGEILNPKADWRTVLRRFCVEENKDDYSWMRPNKRYIGAGFYIPSLHSHGMGELVVAVNLSGVEFKRGNLVDSVTHTLARTGLPPTCLELELTESMLMHDVENVISTLQRLKALGVRLSIDDFGTGYSCLSYLTRFDVDTLKIDQSFVRQLHQGDEHAAIIRAVIQMAHSLNLATIAEGVEDAEVLTFLRAHACDQAQGYFFSRPLPAETFAEFVRQHVAIPAPNA